MSQEPLDGSHPDSGSGRPVGTVLRPRIAGTYPSVDPNAQPRRNDLRPEYASRCSTIKRGPRGRPFSV
ncbi:hypothetical protein FRUB_07747 [Fimbriiglobus ruber]|uniref:Uncharacterized protein n=1 Tax=Fimbriiglobus ruber TaxID=1908690 RepID=A0A225DR63_9BACT|nr:hypothetical protein FRUB_07747 [Fimbriiglobus ruber]